MMLDVKNRFHDGTTHSGTSHNGTEINTAVVDIGDSHNLQLYVNVDSGYSSEDLDVDFNLQDSADGQSWATVLTHTENVQNMTEPGEILRVGLPANLRQNVRLQISSGSSPSSGGDISAYMAM
jgi:hypothetical protein